MKKLIAIIAASMLLLSGSLLNAQNIEFTDAQSLTIVGQLFPDSANPYRRIDPDVYEGFTDSETRQIRQCSGMAVAFRTDSPSIFARAGGVKIGNGGSTGPRGRSGMDLYMRENNGTWRWAGGGSIKEDGTHTALIYFNDNGMTDCIVYLPLFTEITSFEIGILPGKRIEPLAKPFRHRIAVFGSSFTQGYGCSIPSMTWSAQLSRKTGLQFINVGCSGNSKLQSYFAEALADAPVDAYVFDSFSNPKPEEIQERLFPFIETIQAKNPGKPLIFLQTIYREWRYANAEVDRKEEDKMRTATSMMKKACKKYKDVYYITTTRAHDEEHTTTVDGTHPGDRGYQIWAESVREPVLEILSQYGIK